MSPALKLAGFAVILALAFSAAALAGGTFDADAPQKAKPAAAHGEEDSQAEVGGAGHADAAAGGGAANDAHGAAGDAGHGGAADPVRGLSVAENGLRLVVAHESFERGARESLRFKIVDERGRAVSDFDVEHTKRMHVIVVRRDLTGFQHLHPKLDAAGNWTTPLRLREAGSYRVFTDFVRDGKAYTLASDVRVDGAARLTPLPKPTHMATSDGGYQVELDARVNAGEEATLPFEITRDGRPVKVEQYLGAGGHLVALREGDLAFLHVHPTGDGVSFDATFPTAGSYRLFLQFKHAGRVQTVGFTQEVA